MQDFLKCDVYYNLLQFNLFTKIRYTNMGIIHSIIHFIYLSIYLSIYIYILNIDLSKFGHALAPNPNHEIHLGNIGK